MKNTYISHIAESKADYHRSRAKMPYEEKIKIIVELQKIDVEMRKRNSKRRSNDKLHQVWQL